MDHLEKLGKDYKLGNDLRISNVSILLHQEHKKCQLLCPNHHEEKSHECDDFVPGAYGIMRLE